MLKKFAVHWVGTISLVIAFAGIGICLFQRGSTAFAEGSESEIRLVNLAGEQDKVVLDYQSQGCFHGMAYRLEYTPTPTPHLTVTERGLEGTTPRLIGIVTLTAEQVSSLDNTLRFFRKHDREGACTTRDMLEVTVYRNGEKSATESHEDATCSRGVLEDANPQDIQALIPFGRWKKLRSDIAPILSLRNVVALAQTANQKELATIAYPLMPRKETEAYVTLRIERQERDQHQRGKQMVQHLPGYAAMQERFNVDSIDLGHINLLPYSLYTKLSVRTPHLVDASRWFDPSEHDKPRYDWNQFLQVHQAVEKAVMRHRWVSQWKKAGPGRTVESHIFGTTAITEEEPQKYVYPAWRHAGLQGLPRYEVLLRRNDDTWIEVYFGDKDARALVVSADPPKKGKGLFWLDTVTLSYHPTQAVPEYGIVTPDGTWKQNRLPDKKTSAWFKNI